eukprot:5705573-Alexandrium_andersonii.AAC.1
MQIWAPQVPREARSAALAAPAPEESGAPMLFRFRAAGRAVWPVGRAGTATSQGGLGAKHPTLARGSG